MNRRSFLPNVRQQGRPTTQNATEGNGPLAGQTINYDFNLVNFDWVTWHDYEWENWVQVDALLQTAIGFLNVKGIWKANTDYIAGQSVYDPTDVTQLYLCLQTHTSGTDWETDKALYWELRQDASPPVQSVFGRIGEVVANVADYQAFYPRLAQNNVFSQNNEFQKGIDVTQSNTASVRWQRDGNEVSLGVDATEDIIYFRAGGVVVGTFRAANAINDTSYMKRIDCDARYVQITAAARASAGQAPAMVASGVVDGDIKRSLNLHGCSISFLPSGNVEVTFDNANNSANVNIMVNNGEEVAGSRTSSKVVLIPNGIMSFQVWDYPS